MKKILMAVAICAFPFANAFAAVNFDTAKTFTCSGTNLPATPFELSPDSGAMPLAMIEGNTVSVDYTSTNGADTLTLLINENGTTHTISGPANSYVTYVDGAFWVVCNEKQ